VEVSGTPVKASVDSHKALAEILVRCHFLRVNMSKIKAFFNNFASPIQAAILYIGCAALDALSSMHFPPGVEEGNPYARHMDGSFWLWHAFIKDLVLTGECAVASIAIYAWLRTIDMKWAKLAMGFPWALFAWGHLDAAFNNFLLEIPGLFVMTTKELLRQLMGGH
jgi:hypothetical protein